jgi:hypothetical protein
MSDLIDLRAKITCETDAWLDAHSRATGKDRCEIVRDCLHILALEKIDEIMIAHKVLNAKGFVGDSEGKGKGK